MPIRNQKKNNNNKKSMRKSQLLLLGSFLVFIGLFVLSYNHLVFLKSQVFANMEIAIADSFISTGDEKEIEVPTADKSLVLTYDLVISKNGNERVSFNHNFVGTNHYCQAMVAFVPEASGVKVTKDVAGTGEQWGTLAYNNGDELNVSVKAEYGYDSESSEYYVSLSVGNLEPQVVRTTTEPSDIVWCYYYGNDADNYISNIKVVRE